MEILLTRGEQVIKANISQLLMIERCYIYIPRIKVNRFCKQNCKLVLIEKKELLINIIEFLNHYW